MAHSAPIWSVGDTGKGLPQKRIKPLETLQNKCIRLISRAYRRAPIAGLEKETETPPIRLYLHHLSLNHARYNGDGDIARSIRARCDRIRRRIQKKATYGRDIAKTPQNLLHSQIGAIDTELCLARQRAKSNQTPQRVGRR